MWARQKKVYDNHLRSCSKARQDSVSQWHDHINGKHTPFLESKASSELSCGTEYAREPLGKLSHPRQSLKTGLWSPVENGLLVAIAGPAANQSLAM